MSRRITQFRFSGDLRKAQAKGIRHADGLLNTYFAIQADPKCFRSEIREANRLECEAWNALMWALATGEMRPVVTKSDGSAVLPTAIIKGRTANAS